MNVAILWYGQPRFLDNPKPEDAYNRELFSRYACDSYHHHWWGRDIKEYETSTWVASSIQPDPNAVVKIIEKYNPTALLIENPRKFEIPVNVKDYVESHFGEMNELNMKNIFSHLYSISAVSRLAKDSGINYDWYVLARTDMVLRGVPDLWESDNTKLYLPNNHSNFPDTAVIFGPKFLDWSCNMFREAPSFVNGIVEPTAESFKMQTFLNRHDASDLVPCNLYGEVVRSNR